MLLIILLVVWTCGQVDLAAQVTFLPSGGNYAQPVAVSLEAEPNSVVYFTVNGSTPTSSSPKWEDGETQLINESTVLRAIAVDAEGKSSYPVGATYLINEPATDLPIVSVGIDPWRLFDRKKGWFEPGPRADHSHWKMPGANWWTKDEHPGHLDLIEPNGVSMFSGQVGYRMMGGMSRLHPQKSLSISCRKEYGAKRIDYPVFGPDEAEEFKYLVFRNGGSDWSRSHFRDALLSSLLVDRSWDLDHQANRPALLYINGKYWGFYHIREKINKTFVADHRGYDKDKLDLMEHQAGVKAGSGREYQKLLLFLNQHSFYEVSAYHQLQAMMDVDNFMRFQIAQAYFDNRDAGGNIRYFRPQQPDEKGEQKWRWILYDLDYSFGLHDPDSYSYNTLAVNTQADGPLWPNPPWSTFIQRKLLENEEYRRLFANRALDYLQTDFSPETVLAAIEKKVKIMAPEMPRALDRWQLPLKNWSVHVDRMKEFAEQRPRYFREQLRDFFAGGEDRTIYLKTSTGGSIVLNDNVTIAEREWSGSYFANLPIRMRAKPLLGYQFVGWESEQLTNLENSQQSVSLKKDEAYTFLAHFEPLVHHLENQVILTEVGGRKSGAGAWIELYNRSPTAVQLDDWVIASGENAGLRLPSLEIPANGYLVLSSDPAKMEEHFPGTLGVYPLKELAKLLLTGKLGLYGKDGALVDQAEFLPAENRVLAISESSTENDEPNGWFDQTDSPTPGAHNEIGALQISLRKGDLWLRGLFVLLVLLVLGYALRKRA